MQRNRIIDRETQARLDAELAAMSPDELAELAREGGRILYPRDDETRAKKAEYMQWYRARRALAARRGITNNSDSGRR